MELISAISNNRYVGKHGVHAAWALAALFLLLSAAKVAWTAYDQANTKEANYQPQEVAPLSRASTPRYKVKDIVSANLFGDPSPKKVVKKAPKTTLDLTLQGILWASDPQFARAIIRTGKRKTELYSVGEDIKGASASIKEIRDGEVLLDRNGATESLPLVKKTTSGNQQIISYSNPVSSRPVQSQVNRQAKRGSRKAIAPNGAPRKVRKPNFSKLDRALKKMGEI